MLVSLSRIGLDEGMMSSRNTTTPKPPMKCVALRQKSSESGSDSMSSSIVAPVVVKPETLSNQALVTVKGPPQRAYGSMPKRNDSSHDRTMIMYPSFREMTEVRRTKMNGKMPTVKVMTNDISSAASALSLPFATDTRTERSMNSALTRSAKPTLRLIALTFILVQSAVPEGGQPLAQLLVLAG